MSDHSPVRVVELVPGPPLRRLQHDLAKSAGGLVVSGFLAGLAVAIWGRDYPPIALALVGIALVLAAATLVLIPLAFRQRSREAAAGYTTAPTAFINLATVDDRTGAVLREAGEPLLSSGEYDSQRSHVAALLGGQR